MSVHTADLFPHTAEGGQYTVCAQKDQVASGKAADRRQGKQGTEQHHKSQDDPNDVDCESKYIHTVSGYKTDVMYLHQL